MSTEFALSANAPTNDGDQSSIQIEYFLIIFVIFSVVYGLRGIVAACTFKATARIFFPPVFLVIGMALGVFYGFLFQLVWGFCKQKVEDSIPYIAVIGDILSGAFAIALIILHNLKAF